MPKIEQLIAFVAVDKDEIDEGIAAFLSHSDVWMPMIGADDARIESLRPFAQDIANRTGKTIHVLRFTGREVVETIRPKRSGS